MSNSFRNFARKNLSNILFDNRLSPKHLSPPIGSLYNRRTDGGVRNVMPHPITASIQEGDALLFLILGSEKSAAVLARSVTDSETKRAFLDRIFGPSAPPEATASPVPSNPLLGGIDKPPAMNPLLGGTSVPLAGTHPAGTIGGTEPLEPELKPNTPSWFGRNQNWLLPAGLAGGGLLAGALYARYKNRKKKREEEESDPGELKFGLDLSPGTAARSELPKSDFALPKKKPEGSDVKGKYPIPDAQHERSALGFAAMHHGKSSPEFRAVKSKIEAKEATENLLGIPKIPIVPGTKLRPSRRTRSPVPVRSERPRSRPHRFRHL
jgi:hypothetical protein